MQNVMIYIVLGIVAGVLSGAIGIGGGIVIVPALIIFFGFTQHQAQGTTLALMIPPIGFLAAYTYYKSGYVDIKAALLICAGFVFGSLAGAKISVHLPNEVLSKVFGSGIVLIGIYMIFRK